MIIVTGEKRVRNILILLAGALLFSTQAPATAKDRKQERQAENATAPTWFLDRTLAYPEAMYVSATGSGISEATARDDAAGQVALYFESRITVSRSTGTAIRAEGSSVAKSGFSDSLTEIGSEATLPGMRFTEPFLSGGSYYVCAYLSRNECTQTLSAQVSRALSQTESAITRHRNETASLSALPALREAKNSLKSAQETARWLSALAPERSAAYFAETDRLSSECAEISARVRRQLTVSVQIAGDRDSLVKNTLRQIFSEAGFVCLESGARCAVVGEITVSESQNQVGCFVYPGISLRMTEHGVPVSSYARQYDRYGHTTMEAAYRKAWTEIAKDLREHFMAEVAGF